MLHFAVKQVSFFPEIALNHCLQVKDFEKLSSPF